MRKYKRKHEIKIYLENPPPKKGECIKKVIVEDIHVRETEYLNTLEACKFLNISLRHIRTLMAKKEIPFKKEGKRNVFKVSELHKWIIEKNWKNGVVGPFYVIEKKSDRRRRPGELMEMWLAN